MATNINIVREYFCLLQQLHLESGNWSRHMSSDEINFLERFIDTFSSDTYSEFLMRYSNWGDEIRLSIDARLFATLQDSDPVACIIICSVLLHSLVIDCGRMTFEFPDMLLLVLVYNGIPLSTEFRLCLLRYVYSELKQSQIVDDSVLAVLLTAIHASLCSSHLQQTFSEYSDTNFHTLSGIALESQSQSNIINKVLECIAQDTRAAENLAIKIKDSLASDV